MSKKVITPIGILSYPNLFTPQAAMDEGSKSKYSAVIIWEEGTDLSAVEAAMFEAAEEKWGKKGVDMLKKGNIRNPIRDDWEMKNGYPENSRFLNAKTINRPGVVDRYADPATNKARVIEDASEMYPGCLVRFSITAFAYDVKGNKGVSFSLNNVQRMGDGERLDGRNNAADEFEAEAPIATDLGDFEDSNDPLAAYA